MHCCEICLSEFKARPQVKKPRACEKLECQKKRQRLNEREWHAREPGLYDAEYHAAKRSSRTEGIRAIALSLQWYLGVGVSLSGAELKMAEFGKIFERFLLGLGVRQINKFWKADRGKDFMEMEGAINPT